MVQDDLELDNLPVEVLVFPLLTHCTRYRYQLVQGRARPRPLESKIPTTLFEELTSSLHPFQTAMRNYSQHVLMALLFPYLFYRYVPLFFRNVGWVEYMRQNDIIFYAVTIYTLTVVPFGTWFLIERRLRGTFSPAVENLVEEYQPKFEQAGYIVTCKTHSDWCVTSCYLRFSPMDGGGGVHSEDDRNDTPLV